jgi:hypothetical protein
MVYHRADVGAGRRVRSAAAGAAGQAACMGCLVSTLQGALSGRRSGFAGLPHSGVRPLELGSDAAALGERLSAIPIWWIPFR